jgi:hypothetical protein
MTHEKPPRFPADWAFVIQFAHPHTGADPRPGRIEHVASGRARRFHDGTQLMAFVAEVLASLESNEAPARRVRAAR